MAARAKLKTREVVEGGGSYFAAPKTTMEFIRSGSKLLDCALGGGWVLGRVSNVVGDKSTGKTLIAIEACANFAARFKTGKIWYRETESAFDSGYAEALGMPIERVNFGKKKFDTVEDIFEDMEMRLKWLLDNNEAGLYIIDSLDALSDREEMARDLDKGSYGTGKAKQMSELFRRIIRKIEKSRMHVMIISQVRDNIGASFGRKWKRSGGRALDFYASHVVYLAHLGQLSRTIRGHKRAVGVKIRAKVDKNKVGLPFREADFEIHFGFGVDDVGSCLDWLKDGRYLKDIGVANDTAAAKLTTLKAEIMELPEEEFRARKLEITKAVGIRWREIDDEFMPKRKKY